MATSIVARGYLSSTFFSIFLLIFIALTSAQYISSTNDTLPTQETDSALLLQLQGSPLFINKAYVIVPLTVAAGKGQNTVALSAYNIQGSVSFGDSLNQVITDPDIAIICCDSTDSINATESVNLATHKNPQAIVLYSVQEDACSLTGNIWYQSIYSLTSLNDSEDLLTTLSSHSSNSQVKAVIYANTTTFRDASEIDNSNEGGPAPTTAVAMSILYSITGIITILFLIIIATGAIRAHRHPERYGPRGAGYPGRQRQSLAKGLAKAILETLPIIKFGDPVPPNSSSEHKFENQVPIKGDTECIIADRSIHTDLENHDKKTSTIEEGRTEKMGPILVNSLKDENDTLESDLGCSICTEDFKTGEDLRVLPCDHKFHPACVDPWLLNVCGTCPLCRFDLRPASDRGVNSQEQDISPPLAMFDTSGYIANGTSNPQRSRISRFFDINLLRHASPDHSIAALRQLRQQTPVENLVANPENPEERGRRSWLTKRLKEVFRIKTRTQTRNISSSV